MTRQVPIDNGLFTWPSQAPKLIGGRHRDSGEITFPMPSNDDRYAPIELGRRGRLWTYTVQRQRPSSPPFFSNLPADAFEPFVVGYVELENRVRVQTRLVDISPEEIEIGMEMELTIRPLFVDEAGQEIMAYFFRPAGQDAESAAA